MTPIQESGVMLSDDHVRNIMYYAQQDRRTGYKTSSLLAVELAALCDEVLRHRADSAAAREEGQNARYGGGWYYCWLIEDRYGTQPAWWSGAGWTTVANDAIWFARKCDAENITMLWMYFGFPKDVVVCEHGFALDFALPAPPQKDEK